MTVAAALGMSAHAVNDDKQETPDPLLMKVSPEEKGKFGDSEIVIQTKGKKEDGQITPDPLERMMDSKNKEKIVEKKIDIEGLVKNKDNKKEKVVNKDKPFVGWF